MTEPEHYRRTVGATHPTAEAAAMDTPAARIRRELAKHRPVNHNGVEIIDPAEALLAEAISTAEAINRDDLGRFAASEPTAAPYRPSAPGSTGHAPATGQSQTGSVLDRIRASAQRHNDNPHVPAGFEPSAP